MARDRAAVAFAPAARWWTVAQIVLLLLLVVQAVRLILIFWPQSSAPAPIQTATAASADLSIFQRFDAFYRTSPQTTAAAVTATGAYRLFGVRSGGRDGGSAIIGLADGRQVSVAVGEEVEPGVTLRDVGADFATLEGASGVVRVTFPEASGQAVPAGAPPETASPPPPAAPSPAATTGNEAAPTVDPARLLGQASLRPRMNGVRMTGVVVSSGGDGSALRAAGLQSGDVILAVNGVALNSPAALGGLRSRLSSADSAEIRFERNGQPMTTTIRTGR